jgi:hypothetical protein
MGVWVREGRAWGCGKAKALTHPGRTPWDDKKDPGRKGVSKGGGMLVWLFGTEGKG